MSEKEYNNPISAAIAAVAPNAENELYELIGDCCTLGNLFDLAMAAMHVCGRGHPLDRERLLSALESSRCQNYVQSTESDLLAACENLISAIEQLIPEPSARGVADVVLAQARAAIAKYEGTQ